MNVSLKQNETPRHGLAQKGTLVGRYAAARQTGDKGCCRHCPLARLSAFGLSGHRSAAGNSALSKKTACLQTRKPRARLSTLWRLSPAMTGGSSVPPSILLDNARTALRFQAFAQLIGIFARRERTDLRAEIGTLFAQFLPPDDRLTTAQQGRVLSLHRAE